MLLSGKNVVKEKLLGRKFRKRILLTICIISILNKDIIARFPSMRFRMFLHKLIPIFTWSNNLLLEKMIILKWYNRVIELIEDLVLIPMLMFLVFKAKILKSKKHRGLCSNLNKTEISFRWGTKWRELVILTEVLMHRIMIFHLIYLLQKQIIVEVCNCRSMRSAI